MRRFLLPAAVLLSTGLLAYLAWLRLALAAGMAGLLLLMIVGFAVLFLKYGGRVWVSGWHLIAERLPIGAAMIEPVLDRHGTMESYIVRAANRPFARLYPFGRDLSGNASGDPYTDLYDKVFQTGKDLDFCIYNRPSGVYLEMSVRRAAKDRLLLFAAPAARRPLAEKPRPAAGENGRRADGIDAGREGELKSFGFAVSHEIKAPVRAIDGYARIFLEDYAGRLDPDGLSSITNIRSICRETIALINKLLDYTRIAGEVPEKGVVDMQGMIRTVFREMSVAYGEGREMKLIFDSATPPVLGDGVMLKQAMTNILSNALKFTRDKPVAVISAGYRPEGNEGVFYVKDNGAGFDMRYSEKLFGMFQRMHSSDEFEGSGIGLAMVRKIIQRHGGRVWITGEVGKGATIYFTMKQEDILSAD